MFQHFGEHRVTVRELPWLVAPLTMDRGKMYLMMDDELRVFAFDNLSPLIAAAVRADSMRQNRLAACWADLRLTSRFAVVGTALAGSGVGVFTLWYSHDLNPCSRESPCGRRMTAAQGVILRALEKGVN